VLKVASDEKIEEDVREEEDDAIYCAACGGLVTRGRWRISMNGDHEHTVFNPAGIVFRVVCFKEAPGVGAVGEPSGEFTWFRGYDWQVALCRGCNVHIGWQYAGEQEPQVFFGLIAPKLTNAPPR
jgi:hypothetical protein